MGILVKYAGIKYIIFKLLLLDCVVKAQCKRPNSSGGWFSLRKSNERMYYTAVNRGTIPQTFFVWQSIE